MYECWGKSFMLKGFFTNSIYHNFLLYVSCYIIQFWHTTCINFFHLVLIKFLFFFIEKHQFVDVMLSLKVHTFFDQKEPFETKYNNNNGKDSNVRCIQIISTCLNGFFTALFFLFIFMYIYFSLEMNLNCVCVQQKGEIHIYI